MKPQNPAIKPDEKKFEEKYPGMYFFIQLFGIGGVIITILLIIFLLFLQALGLIRILV
jgi:hypothetical protein